MCKNFPMVCINNFSHTLPWASPLPSSCEHWITLNIFQRFEYLLSQQLVDSFLNQDEIPQKCICHLSKIFTYLYSAKAITHLMSKNSKFAISASVVIIWPSIDIYIYIQIYISSSIYSDAWYTITSNHDCLIQFWY